MADSPQLGILAAAEAEPPREPRGGRNVDGGGRPLPPGLEELPEDVDGCVEWFRERPELRARATLEENRGGGWESLCNLDQLEDATEEAIREGFGGGKYRVRFRIGGTIVKAPQVRIGGPRMPREGENPPARGDRVEALLERVLEKLSERPAAGTPSADIVGLATAMTAAQAPLLTALAQQNRPEGPDIAAFGDLLMRAIELGRDGGGKGGGFGEVVDRFGVPLLDIMSRAAGQEGGALNPGHEVPAPAGPHAPALPQGAPGWLTALRPSLPQLLRLAAMRGEVEYWTDQLLNTADEAQLEWIQVQLERRPQFEEEFYQWVPEAVPHRAWFSRFWEELAAAMKEDAAEGGEE